MVRDACPLTVGREQQPKTRAKTGSGGFGRITAARFKWRGWVSNVNNFDDTHWWFLVWDSIDQDEAVELQGKWRGNSGIKTHSYLEGSSNFAIFFNLYFRRTQTTICTTTLPATTQGLLARWKTQTALVFKDRISARSFAIVRPIAHTDSQDAAALLRSEYFLFEGKGVTISTEW